MLGVRGGEGTSVTKPLLCAWGSSGRVIKVSFQIDLFSLVGAVFGFYLAVGQTESNRAVLCFNPAAVLLASKQVARPGARAEPSHLGWVLLTLVNWKHSPSSPFLLVLTHMCLYLYFQGSGVGNIDPEGADTHSRY